jgi:hypothetical protein
LLDAPRTDPDEPDSSIRLLPWVCDGELPYAAQRLGHASPGLGPVRALLLRVSLGPRPWLHHLRRRLPGFVRWLRSYYGGVRLLLIVHRRLRLLAFPPRTIRPVGPMANPEISRFPDKKRARMPGSTTTPGRPNARVGALGHIAFRYTDSVGARDKFSIAAQWLACTSPYRRFANVLANACARLGADVDRYSFIAEGLHLLLPAGLPAHLCENSTR